MSLTFLAPLFFIGLLGLAVPVIVHLVNRERKNAIAFPSLMFLRRVPFRSVRRQRIRHWALFALRCIALILLATAFARPFFDREDESAGAGRSGPREIVVLLDRSYSMAYGDRWTRAAAAAGRVLARGPPADRATLVLFDHEATAAAGPTGETAVLRAALQNARPGAGGTRFTPAFAVAQQLLESAERPRRDGVDRAIVAARVARRGARPIADARVTLELNGREVEAKRSALPASGAASVSFAPVAVPDEATRGSVRVTVPAGEDHLSVDDVFHFVLAHAQVVRVLVIERPNAPPSHTVFLPRALGIGDRPTFQVVQRRADHVTAGEVDEARVVILHGVGMPGGAVGGGIRALVRRGGGLIIALGEENGPRTWSGASEILPGTIGEIIDRSSERGGSLGSLDRSHPALEAFRGTRSGDFTAARYHRYRTLAPAPTDVVLARFDDGAVAIAERRSGTGRVMVFASTFDGYWNDLPVQPVFLPLVQSLVRHAAGWTPQKSWETVGQVVSLADSRATNRSVSVATAPSGARTRWTEDDTARSLPLREQGFYEIRDANAVTPSRVIAVNHDPSESELGTFAPDELVRAVAPSGTVDVRNAGVATISLAERERRQRVWWYVLATALLLLAAESLLSNRLSRSAQPNVAIAEGSVHH